MLSQRATGSTAVNSTFSFSGACLIDEIRMHLSAAGGAANMTITIDRDAGAAYDLVIDTEDMTSVVNYHLIPTRPIYLFPDDKLVVAWANANGRTYGLEILYRGA